jgi:hypothetical protein
MLHQVQTYSPRNTPGVTKNVKKMQELPFMGEILAKRKNRSENHLMSRRK